MEMFKYRKGAVNERSLSIGNENVDFNRPKCGVSFQLKWDRSSQRRAAIVYTDKCNRLLVSTSHQRRISCGHSIQIECLTNGAKLNWNGAKRESLMYCPIEQLTLSAEEAKCRLVSRSWYLSLVAIDSLVIEVNGNWSRCCSVTHGVLASISHFMAVCRGQLCSGAQFEYHQLRNWTSSSAVDWSIGQVTTCAAIHRGLYSIPVRSTNQRLCALSSELITFIFRIDFIKKYRNWHLTLAK